MYELRSIASWLFSFVENFDSSGVEDLNKSMKTIKMSYLTRQQHLLFYNYIKKHLVFYNTINKMNFSKGQL